ncbi:uncharacterized protein LOC114477726 isoform X6 [Gouania willdenowi]|nr:uncharacterized protein LOC114477726 isoform X6 [Gouania willdenowi]
MASASSSTKKKSPGVLDQIGKFFAGDKKTKGKGAARGALSPASQKASTSSQRKRGTENAVAQFFRTIGPQKSQSAKAKKAGAGDGKGTLTRIFKM